MLNPNHPSNFISNRIVVFIDIIGFQEITNKEDGLHEADRILNNAKRTADFACDYGSMVSDDDPTNPGIHSIAISDSVILITNGSTYYDFLLAFQETQRLLGVLIGNRIPVKGYMNYGKILWRPDDKILAGKPYEIAFKKESEYDHLGVVIDESIIYHIEDLYNANNITPPQYDQLKEKIITANIQKKIDSNSNTTKDVSSRVINFFDNISIAYSGTPPLEKDEKTLKEIVANFKESCPVHKVRMYDDFLELVKKHRGKLV